MSILLAEKVERQPKALYANDEIYRKAMFSAYSVFWTGMSVGLSNLFCG